eukprot:14411752-Alexandrium_andersonii.AAC.1
MRVQRRARLREDVHSEGLLAARPEPALSPPLVAARLSGVRRVRLAAQGGRPRPRWQARVRRR